VVPAAGTGLFYIDPADPDNISDPLRGQYVFRRDIQVVGKATVRSADGGASTAWVTEKVSARAAPLFASAVFYDANDLELSPGPNFDLYGPVHVNGNMFVSAQGSKESGTANSVSFHGPVSITGHLFHAWSTVTASAIGQGLASSSSGEALSGDPVNFSNAKTDANINMYDSSSSKWRDSTLGGSSTLFNSSGYWLNTSTDALTQLKAKLDPRFRTTALSVWEGNVQTYDMEVGAYHPVSFTQPLDSAGTVADTHTIIDPPTTLSGTDPYYAAKQEVENQKLSNQAGLYVEVDVTPNGSSADTAVIKVYSYPGSAPTGTAASLIGPNTGLLIASSSSAVPLPSKLIRFVAYEETTGSTKYAKAGMYDNREDKGVNVVQLNMYELRAALADAVSNSNADGKALKDQSNNIWGNGTSGGYVTGISGSTGWNGGVYVHVKTLATTTKQTSVFLTNGQVTNSTTQMLPTVNGVKGLMLATNAPVYVLGNYNTTGSSPTAADAATTPDDGNTNAPGTTISTEIPAAIAADSVTILSPDYFGNSNGAGSNGAGGSSYSLMGATTSGGTTLKTANDTTTTAYKSRNERSTAASASVEISSAILTGIVSTGTTSGSSYSGGVHNLPRFLENWGSGSSQKTVAIRGSMVALFKSKTAIGPWAQENYSAPKRNWGFNVMFKNGYFPPLTPKVMSYRRIETSALNEGSYAAAKHSMWPSLY
jgi:hypothetical protein